MKLDESKRRLMRIKIEPGVRVFAKALHDGEMIEITENLYFFEEEGIVSVDGKGWSGEYEIWIETPEDEEVSDAGTIE